MCLHLFLEQRPYSGLIKLRITSFLSVELTPTLIKMMGSVQIDFYCLAFVMACSNVLLKFSSDKRSSFDLDSLLNLFGFISPILLFQ